MTGIPESWQREVKGANLTSIQVGGQLSYFVQPKSIGELREVLENIQELKIPYRIIGGGSNLLFSDRGFTGVVVQPDLKGMKILRETENDLWETELKLWEQRGEIGARYEASNRENFLNLKSPQLPKRKIENTVLVELEAGIPWGQAVAWSLNMGLSGLHWFARIPCRVGGAVYNNIHGEKHFLSDAVVAVKSLNPITREEKIWNWQELNFAYDYSVFHTSKQIITAAILGLAKVGEKEAQSCRQLYMDWTQMKAKTQPAGPNSGSVFKNLSVEQAEKAGGPVAAAWYIDQCGFRGKIVGAMQVYLGHANFIINLGKGTQVDFCRLVQEIHQGVKNRYGIDLEPEVECLDYQGENIRW